MLYRTLLLCFFGLSMSSCAMVEDHMFDLAGRTHGAISTAAMETIDREMKGEDTKQLELFEEKLTRACKPILKVISIGFDGREPSWLQKYASIEAADECSPMIDSFDIFYEVLIAKK